MFAPCPHCGFLVALATTRHNPKQRCPRCDELLRAEPAKTPKTKAEAKAATPAPAPAELPAPAQAPAPTEREAPAANAAASASKAEAPAAKAQEPASKAEAPVAKAQEPASKAETPAAKAGTPAEPEAPPAPATPSRRKPVAPEPGSAKTGTGNAEGDDAAAEKGGSGKVGAIAPDAVDPSPQETAGPTVMESAPAEPAATQFEDSIAAAALAPATARAVVPRRRAETRGMPSFARVRQPVAPRKRSWRGPMAIAALSLLLALQLLLAQRTELAAQARWRPVVAALCGALRCELPPWHEPTAFTMLGRNVQPKPGMAGVLSASASFRNDARWAQPWPTLVLSLSDIDGRQVGQRAFAPAEYREPGTADLLAPGESATVQLDVIEPAPRIVAFTFDFQ